MNLTREHVLSAQEAFQRHSIDSGESIVLCTRLQFNGRVSHLLQARVWMKYEIDQIVKSFKIRGAFYKILKLIAENPKKNFQVVCASAGNHAQGVALSCKTLHVKGIIYMPKGTPQVKIDATRLFGGEWIEIKLVGNTYDEAKAASKDFCQSSGGTYVDAFDDPDVIAGQGTVGLEIQEQMDTLGEGLDYIFVPVGGGGILAGLILAMQGTITKVIGVEQIGSESMFLSIQGGKLGEKMYVDTFAEGTAVAQPGTLPFGIIRDNKVPIVTVTKNRLAHGVHALYNQDSVLVETSAGLSVAGLEKRRGDIFKKNVVSILTGANIGAEKIEEVGERSERFLSTSRRYFVPIEFMDTIGKMLEEGRYQWFFPEMFSARGEGTLRGDIGAATFRFSSELSGNSNLPILPGEYGFFDVECCNHERLEQVETSISDFLSIKKTQKPFAIGYLKLKSR